MGRKRKEIDREQKETTERIKKRLKPIHDKGLYSLGEFDGEKGTEELTLELLNEHPDLRDFLLLGVPFPSEFDGKKDE
jgi:hypothetical protein